MPPKLTLKQQRILRLQKEAEELKKFTACAAKILGEEIAAATANPYTASEISFKSAVLAYVGHSSEEDSDSQQSDTSEDETGESALDIEWSLEEQDLLDDAKHKDPKIFEFVQNHSGLYKTFFRFMHCLPSEVIGPQTFLEFDSSLAASTRWTMHFCERLGELVPQPIFRGSPVKLALAIQWTVICRTMDQRQYRLSGCEDDGFLQCLTKVIAESQDGTKSCVELREAARKLYREEYPKERFAEPLWCQLLRLIEDLAVPAIGPPDEAAPDAWDDPYKVHTEDLTTVCTALDRMRHLSLRMFTDTYTVHTTAAMRRHPKDKPLKPEAQKAWEAHMIVWQREKATRGSQQLPPPLPPPPPPPPQPAEAHGLGIHSGRPAGPSSHTRKSTKRRSEARISSIPPLPPPAARPDDDDDDDGGGGGGYGDDDDGGGGGGGYSDDDEQGFGFFSEDDGPPLEDDKSLERLSLHLSNEKLPSPTPGPKETADEPAISTPRARKRPLERSQSVTPRPKRPRKRARKVLISSESSNSEPEFLSLSRPRTPSGTGQASISSAWRNEQIRSSNTPKPTVEGSPILGDSPMLGDSPTREDSPTVEDSPIRQDSPTVEDRTRQDSPTVEDSPTRQDSPTLADNPTADIPSPVAAPSMASSPGQEDRESTEVPMESDVWESFASDCQIRQIAPRMQKLVEAFDHLHDGDFFDDYNEQGRLLMGAGQQKNRPVPANRPTASETIAQGHSPSPSSPDEISQFRVDSRLVPRITWAWQHRENENIY